MRKKLISMSIISTSLTVRTQPSPRFHVKKRGYLSAGNCEMDYSSSQSWLTHSFIHSSIHSFIHSFIHSVSQSVSQSVIHSFTHSYSFIHSFTHSFVVWGYVHTVPDRLSTSSKFVRLGVLFTRNQQTIGKFRRLSVQKFVLQNRGQSFSRYVRKIWPARCVRLDRLSFCTEETGVVA